MYVKMKYRFYNYVYICETDHYEKILFKQSVNNIQFIFSRSVLYIKTITCQMLSPV